MANVVITSTTNSIKLDNGVYEGAIGAFTVDSIDGNTPSSNSDLYDKFIALII